MKDIVNVEAFLIATKSIYEAQISCNVNIRKLIICQNFSSVTMLTDFKAIVLTIDTKKNSIYLKHLETLVSEIVSLYDIVKSLPKDYNKIGGDVQLVCTTHQLSRPDISIYKDYNENGKWIWRLLAHNYKSGNYFNTEMVLLQSLCTTEPEQYNDYERINNDIIYEWVIQINNIFKVCDIQPQKEKTKFEEYLFHTDKTELLKKLHILIDNTKTKNIVTVLIALQEKGYILISDSKSKLYQAMMSEFTIKITTSGANDFFRNGIAKNDIEHIKKLLD